jgi:hypothetical protein
MMWVMLVLAEQIALGPLNIHLFHRIALFLFLTPQALLA